MEEVHPFINKGITTSLNEQAKDLKSITNSGRPFEDNLFLPNESSLYHEEKKDKRNAKPNPELAKKINKQAIATKDIRDPNNNYSFKRLSEYYNLKDLNILKLPKDANKNPDILMQDIKPGELGDSYFFSAIAALATNPNRIKQLFPNTTINNSGVFEVKAYVHGNPTSILLDDYFVYKGKKNSEESNEEVKPELAFARINEATGNLWPLLLEKAWAKVNTNYENISAGNCTEAFEFLSPAPYSTIYHNVHQDIAFQSIKNAIDKNYIVCCDITAPGNSKEFNRLKALGLITNHSYYVLETAVLSDIKGEKIQLLRVKNPWGTNEWDGDWSDKSSKWTDDYKKALNYEDKEDGIFWISIKDYLKFYTTTHICHERDNFNYESAVLSFNKTKPVNFFKVKVPSKSSGAIIVNQKNSRIYKNVKDENFENHYGSMLVFKYQNNKVVAIGADSGRKNRMFVDIDNLEAGEYFVALNFPYPQDKIVKDEPSQSSTETNTHVMDDFSVRVGVYTGCKGVVIDDIPEDDNDVKEFFIDYITSDSKTKEENKYYFEEEGEKEAFRVPFFDQKSAYGYIYYENNSDGYIKELITFTELHNVSIMPLLRRGQLSSLKGIIDNSEEPNETAQLNQLEKRINVESSLVIVKEPNKKQPVSTKYPLIVEVTIAPRCCGTILLEKSDEEARVELDSNLVVTYPLHKVLSDQVKFPPTKNKIKYNGQLVDIYESIIEHNSGVVIRYRNKTKNLVFGSFLKFNNLKNLKIAINSEELRKEELLENSKKQNQTQEDLILAEIAKIDVNDFNMEIKDPNTQVALVVQPGEIKFVQLEVVDVFENFMYSFDSTFMINYSTKK